MGQTNCSQWVGVPATLQDMSRRLNDTTPEAEAVLFGLLRQAPPWRKMQMVDEMTALVRHMALSGLRNRYPDAGKEDLCRRMADLLLGPKLAEMAYSLPPASASPGLNLEERMPDMSEGPVRITLLVCQVFEDLGIRYVISGSLASALHGRGRSTYDVDIVADVQPGLVAALMARLQGEFYISEPAIYEALERRSSFNLIHLRSMFKVDVFVPKDRSFDQFQLARGRAQVIAADSEQTARVASSEDVILAKLEWYRLGGENSDRQWEDVLGVLRVQGDRLDRRYLQEMAAELGVLHLLERAEADVW